MLGAVVMLVGVEVRVDEVCAETGMVIIMARTAYNAAGSSL